MLIHEVEKKSGLTKKSIRYYEEEGLITPERNTNNDYREYSEGDLKTLETIKFLRQLNVPILEIKKLKNNELSLAECMKERIDKINLTEKNFVIIKNMCNEIISSSVDFENLDITNYEKAINVLNKEGFSIKDVSKKHYKKILGAIISSIICSLFFIFFIILFTYIFLVDEMPFFLYIFLIILFSFPIFGIIINLVKRIIEIRGGEEDEALKY